MVICVQENLISSVPVRIAQILGNMDGGGVEQVVMNYYRNVDRNKVQFDFFVFDSSKRIPEKEIEALGGRVYRLCGLKHISRYVKTLAQLLKDGGYKLVHCHLSTLSGPALKAAKMAGVPVRIIHNHSTSGGKRELVRNLAKAVLKPFCGRNATVRFACSEYAAHWMFGNSPVCGIQDENVSEKSVRILHNAVDADFFKSDDSKRASLRNELGISPDALVFGHIGRFCPQKNQSFLIDIFAEIHQKNPSAYLLMAGTGEDFELISAKIDEKGLREKVLLLGQRSDTDRLYNAMDCFVLPSNYEGLCVVGVEAQAIGVSCLFSDKITQEVQIGGRVKFLSLDASAEVWAAAALAAAENDGKSPADLSVCGYDIVTEAKKLTEYYLKSVGCQTIERI